MTRAPDAGRHRPNEPHLTSNNPRSSFERARPLDGANCGSTLPDQARRRRRDDEDDRYRTQGVPYG